MKQRISIQYKQKLPQQTEYLDLNEPTILYSNGHKIDHGQRVLNILTAADTEIIRIRDKQGKDYSKEEVMQMLSDLGYATEEE